MNFFVYLAAIKSGYACFSSGPDKPDTTDKPTDKPDQPDPLHTV